jgi:hypothetical protein
MKNNLDIINATFEKVKTGESAKDGFWGGFWSFLTVITTLLFCGFYLIFLNPLGWISIVIMSLVYKFIITP